MKRKTDSKAIELEKAKTTQTSITDLDDASLNEFFKRQPESFSLLAKTCHKFWSFYKDNNVFSKQHIETLLQKYGLTLNSKELESLKPAHIQWSTLAKKLNTWEHQSIEELRYLKAKFASAVRTNDAFTLIGILIYLKRGGNTININFPLNVINITPLTAHFYEHKTPLCIAVERQNALCVKILLHCPGIKINKGITGCHGEGFALDNDVSPLRIAAGNKDEACQTLLLAAGADERDLSRPYEPQEQTANTSCVLL